MVLNVRIIILRTVGCFKFIFVILQIKIADYDKI